MLLNSFSLVNPSETAGFCLFPMGFTLFLFGIPSENADFCLFPMGFALFLFGIPSENADFCQFPMGFTLFFIISPMGELLQTVQFFVKIITI